MRKCQIIKFVLVLLVGFSCSFVSAQTDSTFTDSTVIDSAFAEPDFIDSTFTDSAYVEPDSNPVPIFYEELDTVAVVFIDTFVQDAPVEPEPDPMVGGQVYGQSMEGMSLRMITGQTTHTLNKRVLEFCVQHRFGYFSQGKSQLYGLDESDVRLGFDYGLTRRITVGIGRSSLGKTFNSFFKAYLIKQSPGNSEFSATWLTDMYASGQKIADKNLTPYYFSHRLKYTNQLIISRTFGERAMVSVAPTVIHRNLVDSAKYPNDLSLLVFNARLKIKHGINLTAEYAYMFNHDMRKMYQPCLGAGIELYTSGHIFQIVFSNSNSMNEADSYAMHNGKWGKGNVRMGFNIVRQF